MTIRTVFVCWRDPRHNQVETTRFGWPRCGICQASPQYHERVKFVPEDFAVCIYVPRGRAEAIIAQGSAVVGVPEGDRVLAYYEGWVNGAMQYADRDARGRWEAGLLHASDRMITGYPTIAQAFLPGDELTAIGHYFPKTHRIILDDGEALDAWLNS